MNDQLESELRTALRDRASLVPAASVQRLSGANYRPRRSRLRPPIAIGATAIAAAASGAAVLVISLGAGASNAFAGWTSKPTLPAPGQIDAASAACQAAQSPIVGLPLKLSDTRGPFTFSVYADSQTSAACIKGPNFMGVSSSASTAPVSVPAGQIMFWGSHDADRTGDAYSFADGRTGAGVSAATLVLDDGTEVQATVGNGWFLAWWPGGHGVKDALLTTPSGVSTQTIGQPQAPPCPSGSSTCSSGGSGGGGPVTGSAGGGGAAKGESMQTFGSSVSQ
jgi:hypothetical protein